jgi:hypothetical protein
VEASVTPEEFQAQLEAMSEINGVPFVRRRLLMEAEQRYFASAETLQGQIALANAFVSFFLETIESYNATEKRPPSSNTIILLSRLIHSFQSLCAVENLGNTGYPLHAYTLLRNTFDNNQLTSAWMQGVTSIEDILGVDAERKLTEQESRTMRKKTEQAVNRWAGGDGSGLSQPTRDALKNWNGLFDRETHGANFSMANALLEAEAEGVAVLPVYSEKTHAIYVNRYCEIGWMTHRLLPLVQASGCSYPEEWAKKWATLDECFETSVERLTSQLGKPIGEAIVEFVQTKFPFDAGSSFPEDPAAPVDEGSAAE